MASPADYTDDSVLQFLFAVADSLDACADRGTQGQWALSQSLRTFITDRSGGIVCAAVQKSNARLILAASPEGPRAVAVLLRAVADQPITEQSRPLVDSAFALATHYNQEMRLKAESRLRRVQAAIG
ncbi:hypothetical protein [Dietzia sp. 179-F 9C3 NHS]|uniref:hypothetical protein n=1 Tax=Dietzia sp. 179-F 9C3 NHS TaxID=3374295 RepID=UPI00387911E1